MTELSPPKSEENNVEGGRPVATGALRRVFKSREKARSKNRLGLRLNAEEDNSGSESDRHDGRMPPHTQNTSNHYTLNLPSAPAPQSDTPYILLGYVLVYTSSSSISYLFQLSSVFLQPLPGPCIFVPCATIYTDSPTGCRATHFGVFNGYELVIICMSLT
jgi:hypothetical protein